MRGNVVELAVAVVMGAAMTALVSSFTDAFIEPLINVVTGGGEVGGKFTVNGVDFEYSMFVNGLITFLLTAVAVYFVIVVPVQKLSARLMQPEEEPAANAEEIALLTEIRDSLRERSGSDGS